MGANELDFLNIESTGLCIAWLCIVVCGTPQR
jgi:hypothetical protein